MPCRVELIDGVVYNMAAPMAIHQEAAGEIYYLLKDYIRKNDGKCMVFMAPGDVQLDLDDRTMVQPDVYVCCVKDKMPDEDLKKNQIKHRAFQDEIPVGIYGGECKISLAEVEKKETLLNELGII